MPKMEQKLTRQECEALINLRDLQEELWKHKDGMRELVLLSISVSSPRMDGMPKQQGMQGDAYAQTLARIEERKVEISKLERKIRTEKLKAQKAIKHIYGSFRIFAADYYIAGNPFEVSCAASGVSERQCRRYMRTVREISGSK